MMEALQYQTRNNQLSPPTTWSLDEEGIRMTNQAVDSLIVWKDIREIRLQYAPTRYIANRYTCQINLHSGGSAWFSSHYVDGSFTEEDRGREYDRFVRELMNQTVVHNPACRLTSGAGAWSYFSKLLIMSFSAWMLFVLFKLFMAFGLTWLAVLKLTVVAFLMPRLLRWLKVSKGTRFTVHTIPAGLLPSQRYLGKTTTGE